jgi:hypothetical protein
MIDDYWLARAGAWQAAVAAHCHAVTVINEAIEVARENDTYTPRW